MGSNRLSAGTRGNVRERAGSTFPHVPEVSQNFEKKSKKEISKIFLFLKIYKAYYFFFCASLILIIARSQRTGTSQ